MANPYATIQKAIDHSRENGIIYLLPGTYQGSGNRNLSVNSKSIRLKSTEGFSETIIDCGGNSIATARDNAQLFLDGLTIQNAKKSFGTKYQSSGLVDIKNSSYLEAQNCIFLRNEITAGSAAFIHHSYLK